MTAILEESTVVWSEQPDLGSSRSKAGFETNEFYVPTQTRGGKPGTTQPAFTALDEQNELADPLHAGAEDPTDYNQKSRPCPVCPPVRLIRPKATFRNFNRAQYWEGIVKEVYEDTFLAELHDLTDDKNPVETAEILKREISAYDQALLLPGRVFYWSIGYETSKTGQIKNVSEIKLKRTPTWSSSAIRAINKEANKLDWWLKDGDSEEQSAKV